MRIRRVSTLPCVRDESRPPHRAGEVLLADGERIGLKSTYLPAARFPSARGARHGDFAALVPRSFPFCEVGSAVAFAERARVPRVALVP